MKYLEKSKGSLKPNVTRRVARRVLQVVGLPYLQQ
jgi:hypothetical protein